MNVLSLSAQYYIFELDQQLFFIISHHEMAQHNIGFKLWKSVKIPTFIKLTTTLRQWTAENGL